MSRSTPIFALGLGFIIGGLALFVFARRLMQAAAKSAPKRKSDERAQAIDQKNNAKLSLGGGILAGFGALLVAVSFI
jgi:Na+-transporting methylmalonyl-CoA/oxaloacetate decarboxylase gamma subunit